MLEMTLQLDRNATITSLSISANASAFRGILSGPVRHTNLYPLPKR